MIWRTCADKLSIYSMWLSLARDKTDLVGEGLAPGHSRLTEWAQPPPQRASAFQLGKPWVNRTKEGRGKNILWSQYSMTMSQTRDRIRKPVGRNQDYENVFLRCMKQYSESLGFISLCFGSCLFGVCVFVCFWFCFGLVLVCLLACLLVIA